MRPKERRDSGQNDMFRSRLDQIVNLNHALAKLARAIDWRFLEKKFGAVYKAGAGPAAAADTADGGAGDPEATCNLSDEVLCERWVENPYYQLFCGEEFFQHSLPFDRTSITRWRQRMGEEKLKALVQESLATCGAHEGRQAGRLQRRHRRHDGAGKGDCIPDRCQADAPGARAPW